MKILENAQRTKFLWKMPLNEEIFAYLMRNYLQIWQTLLAQHERVKIWYMYVLFYFIVQITSCYGEPWVSMCGLPVKVHYGIEGSPIF